MLPAFGPVPGGPELVVLLVTLSLFGSVVAAVSGLSSHVGDEDDPDRDGTETH